MSRLTTLLAIVSLTAAAVATATELRLWPKQRNTSATQVWYLERATTPWRNAPNEPWTPRHVALLLVFSNGLRRVVEYGPKNTDDVWSLVLPSVSTSNERRLEWRNAARILVRDDGDHVRDATRALLGEVPNKKTESFHEWTLAYANQHPAFEPLQIVLPPNDEPFNSGSTCHDFVFRAAQRLGLSLPPTAQRDRLFVYAETLNPTSASTTATFARYAAAWKTLADENALNVRNMLSTAAFKRMRPAFLLNGTLHGVTLREPYVDACRTAYDDTTPLACAFGAIPKPVLDEPPWWATAATTLVVACVTAVILRR